MNRLLPLFLLITSLWLLAGCSNNTQVAGGTEDGNPVVSGIINHESDPAPGVVVTLYPQGFNPITDDVKDTLRDITDELGGYQITVTEGGLYNLQAFHPEANTTALVRDIEVPGEGDSLISLSEITLQSPAALTIYTQDRDFEEGGTIYIPGTSINAHITPEVLQNSQLAIELPSSEYAVINYAPPNSQDESNILIQEKSLQPGEQVAIGPFEAWQDTLTLVINTSSTGADVTENVLGFPLLVRLNGNDDWASSLFDAAAPAGSDLRITGPDGVTQLTYEIERWSSMDKLAEVWVKLDTLYGNNNTQNIILYTGNDRATTQSTGPGVFDATGNYTGVWHLQQDPAGSAPQIKDASFNENHGTAIGNFLSSNRTEALIGPGASFSDSLQHISTQKEYTDPDVFTVSAWFRTTGNQGGELLGFHGTRDSITKRDRHVWVGDSGRVFFGIFPPVPDSIAPEDSSLIRYVGDPPVASGIRRTISSAAAYNDGNWHYVTARLSEKGMVLYVDGTEVASNTTVITAENFTGSWKISNSIKSNWEGSYSGSRFPGVIDEVRVMHQEVTEEWIKLNYETQKAGSSVVSFGN